MRACEHRATLIPYNFLRIEKSDPLQPIQRFSRKDRCMPDVTDFQTGDQFEGLGPVGTRVARDSGLGVTLGPTLHVTRLRRAVFVDPRTITPLRIKRDAERRISHHQPRLALAQQPRDRLRAGRVAAEDPVRTEEPQITEPRYGRFRQRRRGVGFLLVVENQESINLAGIESRETKVEVLPGSPGVRARVALRPTPPPRPSD